MREMGASDAYMYYANAGTATTMEIKIPMVLAEPVRDEELSAAAGEALALFPEFAVRPVILRDHPVFEENSAPVRVIRAVDDGSFALDYGTEDTNGHVLFFLVDERDDRRVTFCYYHAMSDFVGGLALLKTILYHYLLRLGQAELQSEETLAQAGIRACVPEGWDLLQNLDPYTCFAHAPEKDETPASAAPASAAPGPAFTPPMPIFPAGSDYNHIYHVVVSTSAFLQKARSVGTSFAPLLVSVLAETVSELYGADREPVVVHLPVDIRPIYGAHTVTNFSDGVQFRCDRALLSLPLAERCARLKESMAAQRTKERFDRFLWDKAEGTRAFLRDPDGYLAVNARLNAPPAPCAPGEEPPAPVTFGLTYPGKLDLPPVIAGAVTHMGVESVINLSKFFSIVSTYGDEMTIQLIQRFDGDELPNAVAHTLAELGIEASVTDLGRRRQDRLAPWRLKTIDA